MYLCKIVNLLLNIRIYICVIIVISVCYVECMMLHSVFLTVVLVEAF